MTIKLEAQKREILGKKVKALRKEGFIPAEIFGPEIENKHISISQKAFKEAYKEAGKNTVIEVNLEGEKNTIPTIISDIQIHPLSRLPLAVDFYMVSRDTKIEAEVPLNFIGEAPAEKDGLIVIKVLNEIEIEAFPQDIPHEIKVDITNLKTTKDHVLVKHLEIPSNVKLITSPETTVVTVSEKEEEIIEEETTPSDEKLEEKGEQEDGKEEKSSEESGEVSEKENK